MKISVVSLGCNKNLVDMEVMLAHLGKAGCVLVDEPEEADCLLINTCSFLQDAVEESLDRIVELAQLKGEGKPGRLVVTGCLVSRYGEQILKEIPEIDALVWPSDLSHVVEAVQGAGRSAGGEAAKQTTSNLKLQTSNVIPPTSNSQPSFPPRVLSWPPHRAYLKIGEGCSNRCSYCLIPELRGEFVSRTTESLLAEMEHLVRIGVREVTLVAQDSGRYGTDHGGGSLPALIESLLSVTGDYWLRVLYVHPKRVTEGLLTVIGSDPRICRYLDIPFQHVSPRILEKMGRGDAPLPMEVIRKVRSSLSDVFLRTTLMAGFPGETVKEFEVLLDFLREARVDHLGVFAYSREEGTAAAGMRGQIDPQLARDRADILMQEQAEISSERLSQFVGLEMLVLVEGSDEEGPYGRHQGQAPEVDGVVRLGREAVPGTFVTVRITGSDVYDLEGEIIKQESESRSQNSEEKKP